ncbi:MAG: hypothetical protein AAF126_19355, partial [Chloroflexota bacterium]
WRPISHAICACCGTTFGLQDANYDLAQYRRMQWLTYGAGWFKEECKPEAWTVEALTTQLKNIPYEWWCRPHKEK